eukprot:jgi/Chrzof1/3507/Cz12g28010.t1
MPPHLANSAVSVFLHAYLQHRMINSGFGAFHYVDCIAHKANKRSAMEYVANLYHIPMHRCAAAGDSGNDLLMLAGGDHHAIVMSNCQADVKAWAQSAAADHPGWIHQPRRRFAAGLVDGLTDILNAMHVTAGQQRR